LSHAFRFRAKSFAKIPFLILVASLVHAAGDARGELPPSAYVDMQEKAPEALIIDVKDVKTKRTRDRGLTRTEVMARARIMVVERTKTLLKKDEIIFINYVHDTFDTPVAGPSQPPILTIGKQCPAFLEKHGKKLKEYRPAAGGYSFEKVVEAKTVKKS
jgi:hypothetical protein